MEATIHITGRKVAKALGVTCLAAGVVAVSAVVASGAAVGAVVGGFEYAKNTVREIWKKENATAGEAVAESNEEIETIIEDGN